MNQPVSFAVEVADRQQVRPLAHEREDGGRDRRHPRREEGGVLGALEFGELLLQPTDSWVVPSGIDEGGALTLGGLHDLLRFCEAEGRALVDRCRNRAGFFVQGFGGVHR